MRYKGRHRTGVPCVNCRGVGSLRWPSANWLTQVFYPRWSCPDCFGTGNYDFVRGLARRAADDEARRAK